MTKTQLDVAESQQPFSALDTFFFGNKCAFLSGMP